MARIALLCPDLLFGSRLRSALEAAGHEVLPPDAKADLLVVDLTADAESRIAAQATREERLAIATHVVDNTGSLDDLRRQVEAIHAELAGRA